MATVSPERSTQVIGSEAEASEPSGDAIAPELWFDRSSITADLMVTLEDVSESDWWKHAPEGRFCEYLDGVVYMPSPATDEHQDDVGFWFSLLNLYTGETRLGLARLGPGVLRLAPGRNPEPDVFVVAPNVGPNDPPALLVVETLSPSTRSHDTRRKRDAYQAAGIREIVYVDLQNRRIIVHRRENDLYATEILVEGPWRSVSIPGFWINVSWLWQNPLPSPLRCLQSILAGPPA